MAEIITALQSLAPQIHQRRLGRQIARAAGCSYTTVQRALSGDDAVAEGTASAILHAAAEALGGRAEVRARSITDRNGSKR